jgi:membrane-bound inhibitor of C-type lysozyme
MKKNIGIIVTFIALAVVGYFVIKSMNRPLTDTGKTVVFTCEESKTITATFYPSNDVSVDLHLSDGRKMSLLHATSADGARYTNSDESVVFWNKGNTAFMTEADKTTFVNCIVY